MSLLKVTLPAIKKEARDLGLEYKLGPKRITCVSFDDFKRRTLKNTLRYELHYSNGAFHFGMGTLRNAVMWLAGYRAAKEAR